MSLPFPAKRLDAIPEPVPAATVVLVRDDPGQPPGVNRLEALMVRRNSDLAFAGGAWVFPGGRIDSADYLPDHPDDLHLAARNAAVREAAEEAGLTVDPASLVAFAHWTPPPAPFRRYATWFFVARAPSGTVSIDGAEILDHAWLRPEEALRRRDAGEIELIAPTWITLNQLARLADSSEAIEELSRSPVRRYVTHMVMVPDGSVALYEGDAGYEDLDIYRPGNRNRLWMTDDGWSYECSTRS